MAVWESEADYNAAAETFEESFTNFTNELVEEHSFIDVATCSTSRVCCKMDGTCGLDPEECSVSVLGMGDTWASNCAQCPSPCTTDYGVCSMLSSKTCLDIGRTVKASCSDEDNDDDDDDEDGDNGDESSAANGGGRLLSWTSVLVAAAGVLVGA